METIMNKKLRTFALLVIAGIAILSACTEKKAQEVGLQVTTQYGVLEGFQEDGVNLVYPPYDMGPYASGFIEVFISYEELLGRDGL